MLCIIVYLFRMKQTNHKIESRFLNFWWGFEEIEFEISISVIKKKTRASKAFVHLHPLSLIRLNFGLKFFDHEKKFLSCFTIVFENHWNWTNQYAMGSRTSCFWGLGWLPVGGGRNWLPGCPSRLSSGVDATVVCSQSPCLCTETRIIMTKKLKLKI